ncbi:hypothetical protein DP939_01970 [Spongiactinospora rosea]|uniref:Uncharacterized protein n=1 Tax=Spongiactinospora rosea TaxID=2248750 RepID=A0A366M6Z6_9ACTN|nr:DUF6463 family protein [Spongiactinospora rosea]RBQ21500.1 hypothetical protein DP939_01970 [Spongiactinospora rosea]
MTTTTTPRTDTPPVSGLTRWIPRLLIAVAVMHFAWAFIQPNDWAGIAADGFFRSIVDPEAPNYAAREADAWFIIGGVAMLALATLAQHIIRATGRLPAQLGWYLLAIGLILCVLYFPTTGGWAPLILGILTLVAARR